MLQLRTIIHMEAVLWTEAAPMLELVTEQEPIEEVVRLLAQQAPYLERL